MYKVCRMELREMLKEDLEDLITLANENITIGNYDGVPIKHEERIEIGELPKHVTRFKIGNDIIIYTNKYVNTASDPLAFGYFVDIFIKE